MTSLFHDIIFGPVHSRRLGLSLGVNLLPTDSFQIRLLTAPNADIKLVITASFPKQKVAFYNQ